MVEYRRDRIDEVDLLCTIIIWDHCQILAIQLHDLLDIYSIVSRERDSSSTALTSELDVYSPHCGPM